MPQRGLLSISEFSKFTGIPRSKLIYYDDIGLLVPFERGENNYRYYTLSQIISAGFINDMTSFGVSLKELKELSLARTPENTIKLMDREIKDHQQRINELRESQSVMQIIRQLIQEGLDGQDGDIHVTKFEPRNFLLGNENLYQGAANFYPAWLAFLNSAKRSGVNVNYPMGGYFDSIERFRESPNIPSRYYFVNPHGKHTREAGTFLTGFVKGFYGSVNDLPQRMLAYAQEHKLTLTGPVYNTFLIDEISVVNPEDYLMRASVRIVEEES